MILDQDEEEEDEDRDLARAEDMEINHPMPQPDVPTTVAKTELAKRKVVKRSSS